MKTEKPEIKKIELSIVSNRLLVEHLKNELEAYAACKKCVTEIGDALEETIETLWSALKESIREERMEHHKAIDERDKAFGKMMGDPLNALNSLIDLTGDDEEEEEEETIQ